MHGLRLWSVTPLTPLSVIKSVLGGAFPLLSSLSNWKWGAGGASHVCSCLLPPHPYPFRTTDTSVLAFWSSVCSSEKSYIVVDRQVTSASPPSFIPQCSKYYLKDWAQRNRFPAPTWCLKIIYNSSSGGGGVSDALLISEGDSHKHCTQKYTQAKYSGT